VSVLGRKVSPTAALDHSEDRSSREQTRLRQGNTPSCNSE
jgi:hypothetical protein